jgi:GNAT superfamily N-acetyltransferase
MLVIREATAADAGTLDTFIRESAALQDGLDDVAIAPENLAEDGFGETPLFKALIAEWDGAPAGFALYFPSYSTWTSRRGLYLEDIYVHPAFRRRGIARALMARLARIALDYGGGRINWLVLRDNDDALGFYKGLGAELGDEWMPARVTGEALRRLAGDDSSNTTT